MSALLSPRRGSSLASISSPCLRVKTPAKLKQPSLESPPPQHAASPRTPASVSKRGQQLYSGAAGAGPPLTPFKDECASSERPAVETRPPPGAASSGPRRWTLDDFEIGKPLGRGKFGNVYAAKEKGSGAVVALKVMSKSPMLADGAEKQLQREVAIHSRLVHPHVLRMAGYFHNPKSCFLILEYATGGDLFGELQRSRPGGLASRAAASYLSQLLRAVAHLHRCAVLHRDIKPENCLLDGSGSLKLADYGGAVHAPPSDSHSSSVRTYSVCGTPEYLAPEVLKGGGYGLEVDVWACGVLLHELLVGATPFAGRDHEHVYANVASFAGLAPASTRRLPPAAATLVAALLATDPKRRPSPDAAAAHPWLQTALLS